MMYDILCAGKVLSNKFLLSTGCDEPFPNPLNRNPLQMKAISGMLGTLAVLCNTVCSLHPPKMLGMMFIP